MSTKRRTQSQPSNRASSSSASTLNRSNLLCGCGDRVISLTSTSVRNPHRRFWRCPNWQRPTNCNFFQWVDEEAVREVERDLRDKTGLMELRDANHALTATIEEQRKKILKVKKKLDKERNKSVIFVVLLIGSWMLVIFIGLAYVVKRNK